VTETQPPPEGWFASIVGAVKSLTWRNVLVILALVVIAVPAYLIYAVVKDPLLMARLTTVYRELPTETACLVREVRQRGGPDMWGISTGFAFFGNERWFVSVNLAQAPTAEQVISHCEVLLLTVDWILQKYPLEDGGFHREP